MATIDTVTGDYLRTARGDFTVVEGQSVAQQAWLRLATRRGSFLGDLDFGSLLHLLPEQKMTAGIEELATAYAQDALQPLVDEGRLQNLELRAVRVDRGRLELSLRAVAADGTPLAFSEFVRI